MLLLKTGLVICPKSLRYSILTASPPDVINELFQIMLLVTVAFPRKMSIPVCNPDMLLPVMMAFPPQVIPNEDRMPVPRIVLLEIIGEPREAALIMISLLKSVQLLILGDEFSTSIPVAEKTAFSMMQPVEVCSFQPMLKEVKIMGPKPLVLPPVNRTGSVELPRARKVPFTVRVKVEPRTTLTPG